MKKLAFVFIALSAFAACKKDQPATTPTPTAPMDPTTSEAVGEPQEPSDMRPTGSPVPENTPENRSGGTNQN
jgi:hypothetical protein